jgi:DNA-binding MarR family transcriptional regulator
MLSEQLSVLLVAYTIEYDNEFEHHMPNKTTAFGSGGPASAETASGARVKRTWLASKVMWANFLRYVPPDGVPLELVRELPANLAGLRRWGFIAVGESSGPSGPSGPSGLVKATRSGRWAQGIWRRLDAGIDRRWESRFGADLIGELRAALAEFARPVAAGLPLYLPVVGFADGMRSRFRDRRELVALGLPPAELGDYDLSGLLSAVLLAFTIEYESMSKLPLPISANVLRVIPDDGGVRVADVPLLGGVSREGTTSALGFLERNGYVALGPDPSGRRGQIVRPTERGRRARDGRAVIAARVEAGWDERFGAAAVGRLRDVLTAVAGHRAEGGRSSLALGLEPYPDGWRSRPPYLAQTQAVLADPAGALPRHPMVLHRGGYPDGS